MSKVKVEKKKTGRPSSFTQQKADAICRRLASGESLRAICRSDGMPPVGTVFQWMAKDVIFRDQYVKARETQADVLFDEIVAIADTPRSGVKTVTKESGVEVTEADMIEHRRLQIDARKWVLGRMAPKKYGDRSSIEHSGPNGGPIQTEDVGDELRAKALAAFLAKTGGKLP